MDIKIDASKLTPEGDKALRDFALAASRYYSRRSKQKLGNLKPRSVENDLYEIRQVFLAQKDPELLALIVEMNRIQDESGRTYPGSTEAKKFNEEWVQLDKQIIEWAKVLKR